MRTADETKTPFHVDGIGGMDMLIAYTRTNGPNTLRCVRARPHETRQGHIAAASSPQLVAVPRGLPDRRHFLVTVTSTYVPVSLGSVEPLKLYTYSRTRMK